MAVDVLSFAQDDSLERAVARTLASVFDQVAAPCPCAPATTPCWWPGNGGPAAPIRQAAAPSPPTPPSAPSCKPPSPARDPLFAPQAAPVLTDDHAPVEWLTHRMAWAALVRAGRRPEQTETDPRPARRARCPARELATVRAGVRAGLLVFNDAVIKNHWPGVISGKLSDFAIVLYFPVPADGDLVGGQRGRCARSAGWC